MKLNPPETAPKDGEILASFDNVFLLLATWNFFESAWSVSILHTRTVGSYPTQIWYKSHVIEHKHLRGWLPMPKIDDQGNVI